MATIRTHWAELVVPGSPRVRLHYAQLAVPDVPRIRIHHAELETTAGGTTRIRIHHASLTTPAAPDTLPASGVMQLLGDGNWHNLELRQLSGGVWQ